MAVACDGAFFEMRCERRVEQGEEVAHRYDDDDADAARLLERYGAVFGAEARATDDADCDTDATDDDECADDDCDTNDDARNDPARTSPARGASIVIAAALEAVAAAVAEDSGCEPPTPERLAACRELLAPHGGRVCVALEEPLPDELGSLATLLLMPTEAFAELAACVAACVTDAATCDDTAQSASRYWTLDVAETLADEPQLAARVGDALSRVADALLARFANDAAFAAAAQRDPAALPTRLAAARALRDYEKAPLQALRRAATALASIRSR